MKISIQSEMAYKKDREVISLDFYNRYKVKLVKDLQAIMQFSFYIDDKNNKEKLDKQYLDSLKELEKMLESDLELIKKIRNEIPDPENENKSC